MCGILGKITFSGQHESPGQFGFALDQLDHRGPEAKGVHSEQVGELAQLSLGHTRLRILDLSDAGAQPMRSSRSGAVIVYNGEVYNFGELAEQLDADGYRFVSRCDTEVVLACYDRWGMDFLQRLNGMFALAIWDPARRRLLLARDRLGIKPLHYYWDGKAFAFASEVTALTALPSLDLTVSQPAVRQVLLHGHVPRPLSIYENVSKLGQGYALTVDFERPRPTTHRYWDALTFYEAPTQRLSRGDALEMLDDSLKTSVKRRLISDVPVGAFLSGGIDSSLVVSLMREVHDGPIRTFTIGFNEEDWNEAPYAKRIAEHLQTEHRELYLSEEAIIKDAPLVSRYYDEPFADPSNLPTLALSRMTRESVTVALSGDGGDELFWGYPWFWGKLVRLFPYVDHVPRPMRQLAARVVRQLPRQAFERWGDQLDYQDFSDYFLNASRWHKWMYPTLHRYDNAEDAYAEIGRDVLCRLGLDDSCRLTGAMYLLGYLTDDLLTKVDRASMSVALEVRTPILDHNVVQLAASIPSEHKMAGGEFKHLLKALLARRVPRPLWERKKAGFAVPLVEWFRSSLRPWAYQVLLEHDGGLHDWLAPEVLCKVLDDHCLEVRDNSFLIWACLQIAGWDDRQRAIRSAALQRAN